MTFTKWIYCVLLALGCVHFPTLANAESTSRKEAVALINETDAPFDTGLLRVYVNDQVDVDEPTVLVGETLRYTFESSRKSFFIAVIINPEGIVKLLIPKNAGANHGADHQRVYPASDERAVVQAGPAGIETIVAFATERPAKMVDFGLQLGTDFYDVGNDAKKIAKLVDTLNRFLADNAIDAKTYEYFVDENVQFGTRAVRRELKKRVEEVASRATESTSSVDVARDVRSEPLSVNDIRFEFDSANLTEVGRAQLDIFGNEISNIFATYPDIHVTFEGHTDSAGAAAYNKILSERRARSVKTYLVQNFNLPAERIYTIGSGEERPLVPNISAENRSRNRRVEIALGR